MPRPLLAVLFVLALTTLPHPAARAEDEARTPDPKEAAAALLEAFRGDDPDARFAAVEAAREVQHDSLTSPLVKLLSDDNRGIRESAIRALGAREGKTARRKASTALAARLRRLEKDPAQRDELLLAIEALGALEQPSAVKPLLDGIDLDSELELVEARLRAVAEIPDKRAIEGLIDFLARGRRGGAAKQREAARKALQYATGANPGQDRDKRMGGKDADRWRAWWREHEKGFDFAAVKAARQAAASEAAAEAERKQAKQEERKRRREAKREKKKQAEPKKKAPGDGAPKGPDA